MLAPHSPSAAPPKPRPHPNPPSAPPGTHSTPLEFVMPHDYYRCQLNASFTPTRINVAANTFRKSASGAFDDKRLPATIPGSEPTSNETSRCQSTEPSIQWPIPAINV